MPVRTSLVLIGVFAVVAGKAQAGALVSDNFDSDTVGTMPSGWAYTGGTPAPPPSTTVVANAGAPSQPNAIEYYNPTNAGNEVSRFFPLINLDDHHADRPLLVQYDLNVVDIPLGDITGNRGFTLALGQGSVGGYVAQFAGASLRVFSNAGDATNWRFFDPSQGVLASSLDVGDYLNVAVRIVPNASPGTGTYEWLLNGNSLGVFAYASASTLINGLRISANTGTGDVTDTSTIFRLDNVTIYTPEPTSLAIVVAGAALAARRKAIARLA